MIGGTSLMMRGPVSALCDIAAMNIRNKSLADAHRIEIKFRYWEKDPLLNRVRISVNSSDVFYPTAYKDGVVAPSIQLVLETTAAKFGITPHDIRIRNKSERYLIPRHIAAYIAYRLTNSSSTQIGKAFNRDHSTIIASISKVNKLISDNDDTTKTVISDVIRVVSEMSSIDFNYWGA